MRLLMILIVALIGAQQTFAALDTTFELETKQVLAARKRVKAACLAGPSAPACRGTVSFCRQHPYDRFCARGGRTDCSLFPFLKECGGIGGAPIFDRPDLICQRYPFSPACDSGSCRFNPRSIGCFDRNYWGY